MEHCNPILKNQQSPQKFITIGEVMLRLTPPNYEKIRMATNFEASYGGSEANIALALANLGVDSTFFSVVPNNSLGKSAIRWLRSNDVHCTPMILSTKEETPTHRLGTYYLETGYGIRPSKVIYDRMHSALTEYDLSKVDVEGLLDGFDWLHLSGITPALNQNCADFILRCLQVAKDKGLTVSFDGNFRSTLWSWEAARDYCTRACPTWMCCSASSPTTCGGTRTTTPRGTGRTACRCSPATSSRTRSSSGLWSGIPTSGASDGMCGMSIRAARTASRPSCGTRTTPSRASSLPLIFWTGWAAATPSPAA